MICSHWALKSKTHWRWNAGGNSWRVGSWSWDCGRGAIFVNSKVWNVTMTRSFQGILETKITKGENLKILRDSQASSTWLLKTPSFVIGIEIWRKWMSKELTPSGAGICRWLVSGIVLSQICLNET